jgi:hypothetical protein
MQTKNDRASITFFIYAAFKVCRSELPITEKGFTQYGYLKNLSLASPLLLIKDNELRTFSETHIV